jgi:hypothetical protein
MLVRKNRYAVTVAAALIGAASLTNSAAAGAGPLGANVIGNTGTVAKHIDYLANGHSVRPDGALRRTVLYVDSELSLYGDAARYRRNASLAR